MVYGVVQEGILFNRAVWRTHSFIGYIYHIIYTIYIQVVKIFAARGEDFLLHFSSSSCILGVDYSQNASSGHYLL